MKAEGDAFDGDCDDGMVGYKSGEQGYTITDPLQFYPLGLSDNDCVVELWFTLYLILNLMTSIPNMYAALELGKI